MALGGGFIFGGNTGETQEGLARKRAYVRAMMERATGGRAPQNVGEGLNAIGQALSARFAYNALQKDEQAYQAKADASSARFNSLLGGMFSGDADPYTTAAPGAGETVGGTASSGRVTAGADMDKNPIFAEFMGEVGKGISNPYGLAAVAATGNHESKFSSGNIGREWSDPSESGQAGNAGGILSWRAERLNNLKQFNARNGGSGLGSAATQAQFFLQENPALVAALNKAQSVEEAQGLMNSAWKFAGYNRQGGEAGRRLATARSFLGQFQGGAPAVASSEPIQVASLDPNAGMDLMPDTTQGYQGQAAQTLPGTMTAPGFRPEMANLQNVQPTQEDVTKSSIKSKILGVPDPMAGRVPLPTAAPAPLAAVDVQPPMAPQAPSPEPRSGPSLETLQRVAADPMTDPQTRRMAEQQIAARRQQAPQPQMVAQADQFPPAPQPPSAQGITGGNPARLQQLIQAANDPYLPDDQKRILGALIQGEMAQQQAVREMRMKQADPAYQMGLQNDRLTLEKSQLEIDRLRNPKPEYGYIDSNGDQYRYNKLDPNSRPELFFDGPDPSLAPTNDMKEYEFYRKQAEGAGQTPLPFSDWNVRNKQAGAQNVSVSTGGSDQSKFSDKLGELEAKRFNDISTRGDDARARLPQIDQLEALLANANTGGLAAIKSYAGEWGIKTEGISDIEAAQALINKMVPDQRAPGSGSMSDQDLALFKQSLPRLINTPDGNALIVGAMRGISQYEAQRGDIADRLADGELTQQEARKALRELPNPLADFTKSVRERTRASGVANPATPAARPAPRAGDVMQGYRFKGGNPADKSSWEPVN